MAAFSVAAQTNTPADVTAKVGQIVTDAMRRQQIPAMTVAFGMDGRIVYSRAFGAADLENGVPAIG